MLTRMVSISWPRDPPALASQSAGITGLSHRAQPKIFILIVKLKTIQFVQTIFIQAVFQLLNIKTHMLMLKQVDLKHFENNIG